MPRAARGSRSLPSLVAAVHRARRRRARARRRSRLACARVPAAAADPACRPRRVALRSVLGAAIARAASAALVASRWRRRRRARCDRAGRIASRSSRRRGRADGAVGDLRARLGRSTQPGLYELRDGDRAVDVVAAAGGFTAAADPARPQPRALPQRRRADRRAGGRRGCPRRRAGGAGGRRQGEPQHRRRSRRSRRCRASVRRWRSASWTGATTNGRFTAVEDLLT